MNRSMSIQQQLLVCAVTVSCHTGVMQARVMESEDAMAKTGNIMLEVCQHAEAKSLWPCRRLAAANATLPEQVGNCLS